MGLNEQEQRKGAFECHSDFGLRYSVGGNAEMIQNHSILAFVMQRIGVFKISSLACGWQFLYWIIGAWIIVSIPKIYFFVVLFQ